MLGSVSFLVSRLKEDEMTDKLGQVTGREADIVVGVDGSDESFAALRWAISFIAAHSSSASAPPW